MHYEKGKGIIDAHGNKLMTKREADLQLAKSYGRDGRLDDFTRLLIESRVAATHLKNAYRAGKAL